MIRQIAFASCYVYSPAGETAVCARSRLLRALLKAGDPHFITKYAVRVRHQIDSSSALAGFFLSDDVLVPVPRSCPRTGGTWAAAELAHALVLAGVGSAAWPGLRRIYAVRKSATAAKGRRPTVARHYDSFRLEPSTLRPQNVVLIDDVITRGRTLLAAAARVSETFPRAQIRAFALLRTLGLAAGIESLLVPCRGEIRWIAGDARRIP
ncbi:MAG TPA: phosphoribosyltransferase [Steroidobacteraceae bacterium]|nr:phosphoribosyltransferase [Steroidobacteraceae bacterium]